MHVLEHLQRRRHQNSRFHSQQGAHLGAQAGPRLPERKVAVAGRGVCEVRWLKRVQQKHAAPSRSAWPSWGVVADAQVPFEPTTSIF